MREEDCARKEGVFSDTFRRSAGVSGTIRPLTSSSCLENPTDRIRSRAATRHRRRFACIVFHDDLLHQLTSL